MQKHSIALIALIALLLAPTSGCAGPGSNAATQAGAPVLFSINPNVAQRAEAPSTFHGYPILGKVIVRGDDKTALLSALAKGQADKPASGARCFIPRHGLRLTKAGAVQDYVICFQCNYIDTVRAGQEDTRDTIDDAPRVVFNRILRDAGVTIAR